MANSEFDDDNTQTNVILIKGTMVSHYKIVEKIGAGGMGEVYLAEDSKLKRKVALKFLPSHLVGNQDVRARFVREAQTIARLSHPNIISIHEVSEFNGRPFFVMELVEGKSLRDVTLEKPLPFDMIVEYAIQICQGLGEAHRAEIVHRDIKAGNIVVDKQGRIRVLDFGLAATAGDEKLTKTGSTLGTVGYMSPEQVSGRDIDHRSDLFSLGVVLYELIAGQGPFKRDNDGATLKAIIEDNPEPLTRYKSDVPEKLQETVLKLLEKDRELRYQSAEGVIADLKRLMYDSRQTDHIRTTASKSRKSGYLIGIAAVAILFASVLYFYIQSSDEKALVEDKVPMIAVLPFENLGSPDDQYFADGMTDEITSRLAGIKGLGVISRTSSMKYRSTDKSLKEIGAELGVAYILEGTVRWSKVGDQAKVRITPQLIRVSDDRHMWANNYERALMEVFAVQADIAEKIVEQLGITLVETDKEALANIPTENAEAYRLYLRALNTFRQEEGDSHTRKDLDSIIILDPSFALAYALRSEAYSKISYNQPKKKNAHIALESAKKSLVLQPGLPQGHLALGYYYHYVETDYDRAMEQFSLAESRLQNDPHLLDAISFVHLRQGNVDDAINYSRKAAGLDPLNAMRHSTLRGRLMYAGKYGEALQAIDRAIALEPDKPSYYHRKIWVYQSWYGEIDSIIPVAIEALKHCDTMEFAKEDWTLSRYPTILPWDSLAAEYAQEILEKDTINYRKLYNLYMNLGNRELTVAYADSARDAFNKSFEKWPDNPFVPSNYGLLLSFLGECDRATELGLQAKELMSIDDCFW